MIDQWQPENESMLIEAWNEGLSATLIAERLGLTRNAVLGKVHRLRLARPDIKLASRVIAPKVKPRKSQFVFKPLPLRRPGTPARRTPASEPLLKPPPLAQLPVEPEAPLAPIVPPVVFLGGGVSILELTAETCRWPGADSPWRFCGAPVDEGSRYCALHRARGRQ